MKTEVKALALLVITLQLQFLVWLAAKVLSASFIVLFSFLFNGG